jgi:alkanesulfonate monooxygenase
MSCFQTRDIICTVSLPVRYTECSVAVEKQTKKLVPEASDTEFDELETKMDVREKVRVFATCPQSSDHSSAEYGKRVIDVARWSEANGCEGILVYTDNRIVDPWLVAQNIIQHTSRLSPLVAVQPVYMHPYSVAKMVASFAFLYHRRVYLNMVAGGFSNDLVSLDDTISHDRRYDRLVEYTKIVTLLLTADSAVSFDGEFYRIKNVKLSPRLPNELLPDILMSGSSEASLAAAEQLGATAIKYPKSPTEDEGVRSEAKIDSGIRTGMIARRTEEEAWRVAHERFPEDRKGQIAHELAMKTSDSVWHKQLSDLAHSTNEERPRYWLGPFQNYRTFCPYLVGSYEGVADEIGRYLALGYHTFILDIPPDEEELRCIGKVFDLAQEQVSVCHD